MINNGTLYEKEDEAPVEVLDDGEEDVFLSEDVDATSPSFDSFVGRFLSVGQGSRER